MTVKEFKEHVNGIDENYDDLEVVLQADTYKEGYTPAEDVTTSRISVYDNFAKDDEGRKQKHVCVVSLM